MKIRDIEKWEDEYYPKKEKIRRKKPRKKDLDLPRKGTTINRNKKGIDTGNVNIRSNSFLIIPIIFLLIIT